MKTIGLLLEKFVSALPYSAIILGTTIFLIGLGNLAMVLIGKSQLPFWSIGLAILAMGAGGELSVTAILKQRRKSRIDGQ